NLYGYVDQAPTNGTDPSGLVVSTGNNVLFNGLGSPVLSNTQQTISPTFASTLVGSNVGTGAALDWGHGTIVSEPANTDSISELAATYDGSPTGDSGSWLAGMSAMPDYAGSVSFTDTTSGENGLATVCFTGATLVVMSDGTRRAIATLKPGEVIRAVPEQDPEGAIVASAIDEVFALDPAPIW